MGIEWVVGGPWGRGPWPILRLDNMKTKFGHGQSLDIFRILEASICLRFVQATNTVIYMHLGRTVELGQIFNKLWTSMYPEIVQPLSTCSVTRW